MVYAFAAIGFGLLFLAALFLLHFLKPDFDPAWRMISECEIGRHGWMMRLAFFCWGASVLATLGTLWPALGSISGTISKDWLIVIALLGAGIFKTDPITKNTGSGTNAIHTLCGAVVILTFPIAATLAVTSLLQASLWQKVQGLLILGTFLTWSGMAANFIAILVSRIIAPSAGWVGPRVYQGWPNRFLVVTYVLWLILAATCSLKVG
jgi:hypothetical protein